MLFLEQFLILALCSVKTVRRSLMVIKEQLNVEAEKLDIIPQREEFLNLAELGSIVPVYCQLRADMETPVSLFHKLVKDSPSFILESVEGGVRPGRYSFMGSRPFLTFSFRGGTATIREIYPDGKEEVIKTECEDPLVEAQKYLDRYKSILLPGLPPFTGGAVGFIGYETVRFCEPVLIHSKNFVRDDCEMPEMYLMFTDYLLIVDHVKHCLLLVVNARVAEMDPSEAYERACQLIVELVGQLRERRLVPEPRNGYVLVTHEISESINSNMTREEFAEGVIRAKDHIRAGDIFQVVLSQRFRRPLCCSPFELYRSLRNVNPSPYLFFLDCGEMQLVGSSPESHVRVTGDTVRMRPIAGTRPRGGTPEEDLKMEKDLLADEKERAEHVMLVDLARNDLGKICEFGSVKVEDFFAVERYSHVMHIVSGVSGKLRSGISATEMLRATFPAGTVSGAPKVRAMQIISEIEPDPRGPYSGVVGYFGFSGNLDVCITIRTISIYDGILTFQAGAGIVADSVPQTEYFETINKARGLQKACEMAEKGGLLL